MHSPGAAALLLSIAAWYVYLSWADRQTESNDPEYTYRSMLTHASWLTMLLSASVCALIGEESFGLVGFGVFFGSILS